MRHRQSFHPKTFKKKGLHSSYQTPKTTLYDVNNYYDWTRKYRGMVEGHKNFVSFLPHWKEIYKDTTSYLQLLLARQTGKTTYDMGYLAYIASTRPGSVTNYITKDDASLTAMSSRKYRYGVLKSNAAIRSLVRGKTELHKVEFLNDAMTNLGTHAHGFAQFVGKSGDAMLLDEGQDIDWTGWANLKETQAFTQGNTIITGIGGFLETAYHIKWKETDQREWVFDNPDDYMDSEGKRWPGQGWRNDLQFSYQRELVPGEFLLPQSDLIFGEYMLKALAGQWIPKKKSDKHGYHMTQYMMPNLALTANDAKEIYHSNPEYSIESKWNEYTPAERSQYILAEFTAGAQKPFTRESIGRLFVPGMKFTLPADVDESKGPVLASTDWGAGKNAFTVPWVFQVIDMEKPVFKTLYIARLPPMDSDEAVAQKVIDIFDSYKAQPIAMDGWGMTHCVQRLEGYYGTRCRKVRYLKRPQLPLPTKSEYKRLKAKNLFEIDRSWAIEKIVNLVNEPAKIDGIVTPRIMFPKEEDLPWIIDHMTAVEGEEILINGKPYMDYNHPAGKPDDTLHSIVYGLVSWLMLTKYSGFGKRYNTSITMEYGNNEYFHENDIDIRRHGV